MPGGMEWEKVCGKEWGSERAINQGAESRVLDVLAKLYVRYLQHLQFGRMSSGGPRWALASTRDRYLRPTGLHN